ncbi:MAG: transketolase [Enterobacteriaceae bacterium]
MTKYKKYLSDAIRVLSLDAIQSAKSGHPGAVMGMAEIAEVLWRNFLSYNPENPNWINRDRFILSNGHASMLLYSVLHLTGYNIKIEDIKNFRKFKSITPGHPERLCTPGVEVSTGPLGQGIANAVGIAISEKILSNLFNKKKLKIIDNYTYVFLGDGCMMEGISHEACSFAGTMKLGKLIAFYDSNNVSIDGNINNFFTDNTEKRFKSYGWHVINNVDGHDKQSITLAIKKSKKIINKPSLIICKTIIAYKSPNKAGDYKTHSSPLGEKEIKEFKKSIRWKTEDFFIPKKIYKNWNKKKSGRKKEKKWKTLFYKYKKKYPKLAKELIRRLFMKLPFNWEKIINNILLNLIKKKNILSTNSASRYIVKKLNNFIPEIIGGSADLSLSSGLLNSKSLPINKNKIEGNYIHYGVREFGMTAIANGISAYGGFIPYTSTFLIFSEYAKNAIRMASLMKLRHIMVYSHDSINIGEDGPTHQPIEQLSSLRIIPNLIVWRPCNKTETIASWKYAIERKNGPTVIIISKKIVNSEKKKDKISLQETLRGGYIFVDCKKPIHLIIMSNGSELILAIEAKNILKKQGYNIRIVSIPSTRVFDFQSKKYKNYILPKLVPLLIIEAGVKTFWYKYLKYNDGTVIGLNNFGISGSEKILMNFFKINIFNILKKSYILLKKNNLIKK